MNYTAQQIADITNSELIGDKNRRVQKIAFDSRIIYSTEDTAFIAITTPKSSGIKYISEAKEKGIDVIIAEQYLPNYEDLTWIIVKDAQDFLQQLASYHLRQIENLKTIGITGSNGKTVVKEWLYQSLWDRQKTVKSPKSFNSQIGLPLSILQLGPEDRLGLFEVGISKPGEMERLEAILSPEIGILTHIGSAHLYHFKEESQLIEEKLKLFKHSHTVIFSGDNLEVYRKINSEYADRELLSFGFKSHNDVHIIGDWQNVQKDVQIQLKGEQIQLPVQQRDHATLNNALCVLTTLTYLGYSASEAIAKINALKGVEMRLESVNGQKGNLIINDSFNLDLDSLITAFQFIKEYQKQEKNLVLTDFFEGQNSKELYERVAKLTNEQEFDTVFLVGEEISQYASLFDSKTYTFEHTQQLMSSPILQRIEDSLILLKGARRFEIERLKNQLELQKHDTVLEIDLNSILHNINVHKSLLKPQTKMMAMVKAYAYGLGGYEIAEFLQHHHIDYLGVAYADEGVELRKNGITTPIMVMNPEQHSYATIIDYNLEPEIYSFRVLALFCEQLEQKGYLGSYPIHIKVETGMHRLGFKESEMKALALKIKQLNVNVKSIFSHLSTSDIPEEKSYVISQVETFDRITTSFTTLLGYSPLRHILNSSGIANYPEYQFDMVRIGIGMVGVSSSQPIKDSLQNAVRFKTVISQISEIKEGDSVGYNRSYIASHDTRIATLPVGYADGIPRRIGNKKAFVSVKGTLVPVVGNICMDMLMLDIGTLNVQEGDSVTIFNGSPSLEEFAVYCETIPYEVLTSISRRVKRIYIKT